MMFKQQQQPTQTVQCWPMTIFSLYFLGALVLLLDNTDSFAIRANTRRLQKDLSFPRRPSLALSATVDAPAPAQTCPPPNKMTPEARELATVLEEKQQGTCPYKYIVAQTAPAVRIAFSEVFGKEPGAFQSDLLVASLKSIGFDLVLDTNTAADITVCEEGHELLQRLLSEEKPLPLFTSCCPGWMRLVEKSAPELIPYISTCKSPHMMYGAVLKRFSQELLDCKPEEIYLCSVMPCVRKRGESDEPAFRSIEGVRDVDNVITTKDLGAMLQAKEIDPLLLEPLPYDSPFQSDTQGGLGTGAGQLFGATGGVMEAAVRSVYELITGAQLPRLELQKVRGLENVRQATISLFNKETQRGLKDRKLHVAVVHGLGNAKKLVKQIQNGQATYDFVEVMACPGGCIGGGGQPKSTDKDVLEKRLECIYSLDKKLPIRRSHENPIVKALYERHLDEFGSPKAKEVLHVKQVYGGPPEPDDVDFGCDPECNL